MNLVRSKTSGRERSAGRKPRGRTVKVTVTVPAESLTAAVAKVKTGQEPSLSAYMSRALAAQLAADEERDAFLAFLDRLDEELGPPSDADYAWARRFAGQ